MKFIRRVDDLIQNGLHIHLKGYEYHVFTDFRLVSSDSKHDYRRLQEYLGEGGLPDIESGLTELFIQPVLQPYHELVNPGYLQYLASLTKSANRQLAPAVLREAESKLIPFIKGIEIAAAQPLPGKEKISAEILLRLRSVLTLLALGEEAKATQMKKMQQAAKFLTNNLSELNLYTLVTWSFIGQIGRLKGPDPEGMLSQSWSEEWQLSKYYAAALAQMGVTEAEIARSLKALKLITGQQDWYTTLGKKPLSEIAGIWFSTPEIQAFLQVNRFEDILWYNREAFAAFLWWMTIVAVIECEVNPRCTRNDSAETLLGCFAIVRGLLKADKKANFQVEQLLEKLKD